jgi:DNA mismatch repair protein MutS
MNGLTPMMEQYRRIKAEHESAIVLFRMGDFYETFYDDAKTASRVLGIALTTRDRESTNPVPLAGIPYHALDSYLAKLVAAGYRVAICDQVEDPRKAKGLVRREVTDVVTPGTVLASAMLDERRPNFLVAIAPGPHCVGLARVDLSTGEFAVSELEPGDLRREVLRLDPAEIVFPEGASSREPLASLFRDLAGIPLTAVADWEFAHDEASRALTSHFAVANLDGFGVTALPDGVRAAGAALRYLKDLKRRDLGQITSLRTVRTADHMVLDETTQRNLELVEPLERGADQATLLGVLDRTRTAMGARLLREWILYPLLELEKITERLDSVSDLLANDSARTDLAETMGDLCDLSRVVGRVGAGHATPRDLVALRRSLELLPEIRRRLTPFASAAVAALASSLPALDDVATFIREAVVENPPPTLRDGGVIRDGYDAELDAVRVVAREGKGWIARLQATEREATGIPNLKVAYNRVFGYYIEVTRPHLRLVPERYSAKQTLVNAERYVTPELKEHEAKVLTAEEDMVRLEGDIFERVRGEVGAAAGRIQDAASVLARIDTLASLATAAASGRYVRPSVNDSDEIAVRDGRHPVVEKLLPTEAFVPNDVLLDGPRRQILLITGPNMAGKSTYLRQTALIVVMAQMGSFVPAVEASIGLVDRVFTRIGATDALARGRSTFLVEMAETANILHNATSRSLILLDEVGRGTSTFDGLSIAWAVTEHLHNREGVHPRTMFATHYHELTELEAVLPRLKNMNILVRKTKDSIVFLRKVAAGPADQSYGIEVARLAGIPEEVILRAREVLANLESGEYTADALPRLAEGAHGPLKSALLELPLFGGAGSDIEKAIGELDLTRMTPLDALTKLSELKEDLKRGR